MNSNTQHLRDLLAQEHRKIADLQARRQQLEGVRARVRRLGKEVRNRKTGMDRVKEIDREIDSINSGHFSGGMEDMERRIIRRRRRRKVLVLLILAGLIEFMGVPHLRMTYRATGHGSSQRINSANYVSVTGWRKARSGEYGDGCPLIAFIPLEHSLLDYAGDAGKWIWSAGSDWVGKQWSKR